uniref:Ig-like domain-containing protein n=1 Tax=Parastrongyloides trichosuri TaxID=131310 RepID=A0A0N4ZK79_PARTI
MSWILTILILLPLNFNLIQSADYKCYESGIFNSWKYVRYDLIFLYYNARYYDGRVYELWKRGFNENGGDQKYIQIKTKFSLINIKNVETIALDLSTIYKVGYPSDGIRHFAIALCPVLYNRQLDFLYFNDYNNRELLKVPHNSIKCSVGQCGMGFIFKKGSGDNWLYSKSNGESNYGLYIYFTSGNIGLPLIFIGPRYNEEFKPIVACPYLHWVDNYNNANFEPEPYVKDDFLKLEADFNRHRMVVVFETQQTVAIPSDFGSLKRHVHDVFKCGTLVQRPPGVGELRVDVVLSLHEEISYNDIKKGAITFKKGRTYCGELDVTDQYFYGLIPKESTYDEKIQLLYFPHDVEMYYGEKIYIYDKGLITKTRSNNLDISSDGFDSNYFYNNLHFYPPICVGKVENIATTIRPSIDNYVLSPMKNGSGDMDTYKVNIENVATKKMGCSTTKKDSKNRAYLNYYKYKYKVNIKKIADYDGKTYVGSANETIEIPIYPEKFFGTYECIMSTNETTENLTRSIKFKIIPFKKFSINVSTKESSNGTIMDKQDGGTKEHLNKTTSQIIDEYTEKISKSIINVNKKDKRMYKCEFYDTQGTRIVEMHVQYPNNKEFIYKYGKPNMEEFNIEYNKDIVFYPPPRIGYESDVNVECYYTLPGTEGVIKIYNILFDEEESDEDKSLNEYLVPVIIICTTIIVVALGIVGYISTRKIKRRRKLRKLVLASASSGSSSSNASSISEGSLSTLEIKKRPKSRSVASTIKIPSRSKSKSKSRSKSRSRTKLVKLNTNVSKSRS